LFLFFKPTNKAFNNKENDLCNKRYTHANLDTNILLDSTFRRDFIKKQQQLRKSASLQKENGCPEIKSRYFTNEPRVIYLDLHEK
jgi:hypothetical protein